MALFLGRAAATRISLPNLAGPHHRGHPHSLLRLPSRGLKLQVVRVSRRKGSKTGRTTTKEEQAEEEELRQWRSGLDSGALDDDDDDEEDDGRVPPALFGEEPDFWEGEQWDGLGFFVQYMWAFGILFALVACGIAVVTYNDGATDFKDTPAYQESVQAPEVFEETEGSNADVFESNPTEVAPSLE